MTESIVTAYAIERGSYYARAYVRHTSGSGHTSHHSSHVGLGDTAEEARAEALRHLRETYVRNGRVTDHTAMAHKACGRVAGVRMSSPASWD